MNAQNPAKPVQADDSKRSLRDRIKQSPITDKTVKVLAGVGAVTVVVVAASKLKNRSSVTVEATLPTVDITTDAS